MKTTGIQQSAASSQCQAAGALGRFARAVVELESAEEVAVLLGEVLTPSELHDVELRWEIMEMLAAGTPQRQIAAKLGVSLCKITRGAKYLKSGGSVVTRLAGKERGRE